MGKKLPDEEVQARRKRMERSLASAKLEGIELTDKQLAMFDLFDERDWDTAQCIKFVKTLYGCSGL